VSHISKKKGAREPFTGTFLRRVPIYEELDKNHWMVRNEKLLLAAVRIILPVDHTIIDQRLFLFPTPANMASQGTVITDNFSLLSFHVECSDIYTIRITLEDHITHFEFLGKTGSSPIF